MRRFDRRQVLRAAGAAAAAPYFVRASALGAGGGGPAPSDRITMGAIGCGGRGSHDLAAFLRYRDVRVLAVCDVMADRRQRAKAAVDRQYRGSDCAAYGDFRELLARGDIDAVLIATPEHWHAVHCVSAAGAGKDIFCEKPLSLTVREARAVADAVARYNRICQVGTQQRSDGTFRHACELVRNGRLGKLLSAETQTGGPSRPCDLPAQAVPPGLDWDTWLGPAPWAPYHPHRCQSLFDWWNWADYSGGQMTDRGAHDFDTVQWAFGMDRSGPLEIAPDPQRDSIVYRYAGGVELLPTRRDYDGRGWTAKVTFRGTAGTLSVWRGGMTSEPAGLARSQIGPDEVHLYRSDDHPGNFLAGVRTRKPCVADAETACRSVTVCHVGNICYELGRSLRWDPAAERFIADDEANRLLDRPKRQPWRL